MSNIDWFVCPNCSDEIGIVGEITGDDDFASQNYYDEEVRKHRAGECHAPEPKRAAPFRFEAQQLDRDVVSRAEFDQTVEELEQLRKELDALPVTVTMNAQAPEAAVQQMVQINQLGGSDSQLDPKRSRIFVGRSVVDHRNAVQYLAGDGELVTEVVVEGDRIAVREADFSADLHDSSSRCGEAVPAAVDSSVTTDARGKRACHPVYCRCHLSCRQHTRGVPDVF